MGRSWPELIVTIVLTMIMAVNGSPVTSGLRPDAHDSAFTGNLEGTVTAAAPPGETMPPVRNALVVLTPGNHKAVTGADGTFRFQGIKAGTYRIMIGADTYEPLTPQEPILINAERTARYDAILFPEPKGDAVADLKLTSSSQGFSTAIPYNTAVVLDTSGSKNVSYGKFEWEVRDRSGQPISAKPEPSAIPGSSPYTFTFTPPGPGEYTIRLSVSNRLRPEQVSQAEVRIRAINTAPEAYPSSTGLTVVPLGKPIYLRGWGIDENLPSPELYNPGGNDPDLYGKNNDHLQRAFSWQWSLQYQPENATPGEWEDVSDLLADQDGDPGRYVQSPHFTPSKPGRYRAWLVVNDRDPAGSLASLPAPLDLLVLADGYVPDETCRTCHARQWEGWSKTRHGKLSGTQPSKTEAASPGCQDCHGPARAHVQGGGKKEYISISFRSGSCGQCHEEYDEWQKSRHSDGYPFGYKEIAEPLLLNCARCHYPRGYADALNLARQTGQHFGEVEFKKPVKPGGPLAFDFSKLPVKDGEGISCQACHDPHPDDQPVRASLRSGGNSTACNTCHEAKWQNVTLEGTAGEIGSAFEYPGEDYKFDNPHNTPDKCVLCHMNKGTTEKDQNGVRALGGHTWRMRDAGPNGILGGFGPRPDDPDHERVPGDQDDILNTAACAQCHSYVFDFNRRGVQERIYQKWQMLGDLLKERNNGVLPGFKPGKCATCHRGGTVPFDDDPDLTLEKAYTNYKLIKNDRSWGIHNPRYIEKLLDDSLKSLQGNGSSDAK